MANPFMTDEELWRLSHGYNSSPAPQSNTNPFLTEQQRWAQAMGRTASPGMVSQSTMDPETWARANRSFDADQQRLSQQQAMAQRILSDNRAPQGIRAGNMYVAGASPLSALAQGVRGYAGGRLAGEAQAGLRELQERRDESAAAQADIERQQYADQLRRQEAQDALAGRRVAVSERGNQLREQQLQQTLDYQNRQLGIQEQAQALRREEHEAKQRRLDKVGAVDDVDNVKYYVDAEGAGSRIGLADGKPYDIDNRRFLEPGEMEQRGLTQEDELTGNQVNNAIVRYQKSRKDIRTLQRDIKTAFRLLREAGWEEGQSSPFNLITKQEGMVGDAARAIADSGEGSNPLQNAYAATRTVQSTIARIQAGLSQTGIELKNITASTGRDPLTDPDVMIDVLGRLESAVDEDLTTLDDQLAPQVRESLKRRKAAGEAERGEAEDPSVREQFAADKEAAKAAGATMIWNPYTKKMEPI